MGAGATGGGRAQAVRRAQAALDARPAHRRLHDPSRGGQPQEARHRRVVGRVRKLAPHEVRPDAIGSHTLGSLRLDFFLEVDTGSEGERIIGQKFEQYLSYYHAATILNCGRCHKAMAAGSRVLIWRSPQQYWLVRCARCAVVYATYRQKANKQPASSNTVTQQPKPEAQAKVTGKRPAAKRNQERHASK